MGYDLLILAIVLVIIAPAGLIIWGLLIEVLIEVFRSRDH